MNDEARMKFNDEARMTNDETNPNAQMTKDRGAFRHLDFVIPSSLVIRHFSLAHAK